MFFSTNIENELLINSITIFESSYHNKQEYYTDIMKFMILLIEKFKNVSVEQAMIFSVSFQALEFIVLDNAKFGFMYDDYDENTNCAHIKVYSKGNNENAGFSDRVNILNAGRLFTNDSPHSEYICEIFLNSNNKDTLKCGYVK
ncbi:hypothetical protein LMG7974_01905 [Campylobacter majalis]|uniref:Uncharacterized protein n=2 Tax=Campylobacter majalis TaxID=2790656 RepID=A0ABM8QAD7_9BACT|nr:hypothetical protein LMG7974_01905 [Campylobacter majalis]